MTPEYKRCLIRKSRSFYKAFPRFVASQIRQKTGAVPSVSVLQLESIETMQLVNHSDHQT